MPDKTIATDNMRPTSPATEHFRDVGDASAWSAPPQQLTKQNRIELERRDRYGRFGRR